MLKTVKDACELQDDALDVWVSDQIEQLDHLIHLAGNGEAFFEKTHITAGMETLLREGLARLSGGSTQAVFHLKQAMGGGKTHLLVGFGILALNPELRSRYCSHMAYVDRFDKAIVAAFNGRNNPEQFFWGEIARQLGKGDLFRKFWAEGPKAPDQTDWFSLFEGEQPILILLDEMPPYFHYYDTQKIGNGTVADIVTRAFANMLVAASQKSNVCVVVSDLEAAYESGIRLIHRALDDARQETGRQEREITPVDLSGDEIYAILRKRLFKSLPDSSVINDVATEYAKILKEASQAKVAAQSAEVLTDEIVNTYPFHPRLKNLVALFKENERFKQTRGLNELISRLLKSVWERSTNDVFLIGPQHFDLSIKVVREKLIEISDMPDVIAKDIWDSNGSAHIQLIDANSGGDAAAQLSSILLVSSLSTAINSVKGLTRDELLEHVLAPLRTPTEFLKAFEQFETSAWYLHHTPEGRYYFDRQENLTKLLQSLAHDAPDNIVDELIRNRLQIMFKPVRKSAYDEVLALPRLDDVSDILRKKRALLIVSPDSKLPPEEVQRFFELSTHKNNFCILTGDKTLMGSVEKSARQVFAAGQAEKRIPKAHPQREELERKQQQYEQDFTATVLNLFDKVLFPVRLPGKPAQLKHKVLDNSRDTSRPYNGEEQIEKTLSRDPIKLYLDVETHFDAIRDKAEDLLWPENIVDSRWSDIQDRYSEQAGMPWLPPRGLEQLRDLAINRGVWEDLGNGVWSKQPRKKKTSVQLTVQSEPDDEGWVRLSVNPQHAGPSPKIYYAEDSAVSEHATLLQDSTLKTKALRVQFLVVDPTERYETGEVVTWKNKLVIRNEKYEEQGQRKVRLFVVPQGEIRYTRDGSEARHGTVYTQPILIGPEATTIQVFAEAGGLEARDSFRFDAQSQKGVQIDPVKQAQLETRRAPKKMDSREKTFQGLKLAQEKSIEFEQVTLDVGEGEQVINVALGKLRVSAAYIEELLAMILKPFEPQTPVTLKFRQAYFASGHDLEEFAETLGIELQQGEILQ
jgi:hypothetical protein